jgi:hypothetical protein
MPKFTVIRATTTAKPHPSFFTKNQANFVGFGKIKVKVQQL